MAKVIAPVTAQTPDACAAAPEKPIKSKRCELIHQVMIFAAACTGGLGRVNGEEADGG